MNKCTKRLLLFTTSALTGMYAYNRIVANKATDKNTLPTKNGSYYSWKEGNVFYTKTGEGKPVLLIHDINSASSSVEWSKIVRNLQKDHTVYAIDMLGCGLSDKPPISYTIYLYVQLITSFIKDIIKERTDIVAVDLSAPVAIMTNQMDPSVVDKLILINPVSLKSLDRVPDRDSKLKQTIISLPLVGTFIYNLLFNPRRIDWLFRNTYYCKPQLVPDRIKDAYYESAHMDDSRGKFLYASILGNYMSGDIRHAIKKIDKPVSLILSRDLKNSMGIAEEYQKLNSHIEVTGISNCKLYPQLENPEKTRQIISSFINTKWR